MENMLLASIPEGAGYPIFLISVVLCMICGFLIVCFIRELGNKLILLGILTALAGLVFAASMPSVANLAWVMMIAAFFLVFFGATKSN
jgi:putative exporter of polyketide antibiotics